MATKASNDDVLADNIDKVDEYFKMKDVMRTLRGDVKDMKLQRPESKELEQVSKKAKQLRDEIKADEAIRAADEKIQVAKERMDLLKELIRIELLDKGQNEVIKNGKKLKLVSIIREDKAQEDKKPAGQAYKSRNIFRS